MRRLILPLLVLSLGMEANAQEPEAESPSACRTLRTELFADPFDALNPANGRVLELLGRASPRPRLIGRPSSDRRLDLCETESLSDARPIAIEDARRTSLAFLPLTASAQLNSGYPRDRDNGERWAGRGASAGFTGGMRLQWGVLSVALQPSVEFQQNRSFETIEMTQPGYSEFINPTHGTDIDLPQRFGTESFTVLSPGQSYVRIDAFGLAAGVSTENLRWGPAIRNPILLSYAGPNFPHVFVGTSKPAWIGIGRAEIQALLGRLDESDYFDGDPANDERLFGSFIVTLEPRWLPGLYLGAARAYHTFLDPEGGLSLGDYQAAIFDLPFSSGRGNQPGNGLASLFGRWAHVKSEFEVYVEWAREDYSWDLEHFINEPDHSQAYTLGLQKIVRSQDGWVRLLGELTHLGAAAPVRGGAGVVTYYTHGTIIQGHTHKGQLLGAPIGPGSDAQFFGADVVRPWGTLGGFIERVRYDADGYYNSFARFYGSTGHDVELTAGLHGRVPLRDLRLRGALQFSRRRNRSFIGLDGENRRFHWESNVGVDLSVSWWPSVQGGPASLRRGDAPR